MYSPYVTDSKDTSAYRKTTPIIKGVIMPQQNLQNTDVLMSNMNSISRVRFSNPIRNGYTK